MFMNKQEGDILKTLYMEPFINQRILAEASGHSLGIVNKSLKKMIAAGYLDENIQLTSKAREEFAVNVPRSAIILAAGFGMRMVPINQEVPKAFLEVNGEALIEHQIRQLHEAGIVEIRVIVGFMKERFEYLIDKYGVELIVNYEYATKNNLHSLALALPYLSNTYIVPCDIWCERNPFNQHEMYSWYMVSDIMDDESEVRVNRKMELVKGKGGNSMLGICYLLAEDAKIVSDAIRQLAADPRNDDQFWEAALYRGDRMFISARIVPSLDTVEINTYEQLRDLDSDSNHLRSDAIDVISDVFCVKADDITDIEVLKKGMTNRSFLFSVKGSKYIMRIPGEGTDQLINRENEATVFQLISGMDLCDSPIYINPVNGYKITKFLDNIRTCDPDDMKDLRLCMRKLSGFHKLQLAVPHTFDIFQQIEFYESLWNGRKSMYRDYSVTKQHVFSLRDYIEKVRIEWCLTHIDAVPDNFLFYESSAGEELQLTDWEYAGMQDPHVDIAMFCIYSLYHKRQVDRLINLYFDEAGDECTSMIRAKIYCYISACGLLWSNWCEFKASLGIEFGEYSLRQYRFAKDYYRYAIEEMK